MISFRRCQLIRIQTSKRYNSGSVVQEEKFPLKMVTNEPILTYLKGSPERAELEKVLTAMSKKVENIPIVIGADEMTSSNVRMQVMPHNHSKTIATYCYADRKMLKNAICVATEAQQKWDLTPFSERYAIWTKAADLMAGPYRQQLNASTMLGQSKTVIQAEIDAACELTDFIRMHMYYFQETSKWKPISPNPSQTLNSLRYRGIDGFIAAVSPFNFTAIGGNLAYTPAFMGNGVLWKPSDTSMLSNWIIFKIMREAGLPPGVVNFVPSDGPVFGNTITSSPYLAGVNFTGSVPTFQRLWRQIGENIKIYNNFPRISGECGGKNFHFVHPSADFCSVITSTIRSSFEYCGQKCSACSRAYIPESLWPELKIELLKQRDLLKIGDVADFSSFMGAVIDARSFQRISSYLEYADHSKDVQILGGGKCDDSKGYFVEPTIIQVANPLDKLMTEEIFGPVLSIFVYKDADLEKTIDLVLSSTKFALTGAVFAHDRKFCEYTLSRFKMSAGNFYINDKSTGAVVGQQPFGGGRRSGTNDKAGGPYYALRWSSPQSIKETFESSNDIIYPYME